MVVKTAETIALSAWSTKIEAMRSQSSCSSEILAAQSLCWTRCTVELPCTWIWSPGCARQRKQVEWSKLSVVEADRAAVDLIPALVPKSDSMLYPKGRDSSKSILYRRPYDSRPQYLSRHGVSLDSGLSFRVLLSLYGSEVTFSKKLSTCESAGCVNSRFESQACRLKAYVWSKRHACVSRLIHLLFWSPGW